MRIRFWLSRPALLYSRIRYWIWEKLNPDKPWMCPGTIRFCEKHLTRSMRAVEFGSGRSTPWFAAKVGHLTSVEHHSEWYAKVNQQLLDAGVTNVDYRLIPLNHPEAEGERPEYNPIPDYVALSDQFENGALDFAIVDGHYRTTCIRQIIPKIKPGGYLLVDDINLWPSVESVPIPSSWKMVDDSSNGLKRSIIWQAT